MQKKMGLKDNVPAIEIVSEKALKTVRKYQKTYLILEAKYKYACTQ